MTPSDIHFPGIGQVLDFWQLQPVVVLSGSFCESMLALCLAMFCPIFGMVLYDNFTVFLFSNLCKGCPGGKLESNELKNCLPMLVATFCDQGGLKKFFMLPVSFLFVGVFNNRLKL